MIRTMSEWRSPLWDRLIRAQQHDGGWSYTLGGQSSPEPTALACIALAGDQSDRDEVRRAVAFLAGAQQSDGRVPALTEVPGAVWPTALAILAWHAARHVGPQTWNENGHRATDWLLGAAGLPFAFHPEIYDHDTQRIGWAWIEGTHSWLEPTAFAMLALRAAGQVASPRFTEGVQLLRDRPVRSGGWNYGNGRIFKADLRPFPETTGLALAALAGEPRDGVVDAALRYLAHCVRTMTAPLSAAWSVIGLRAWGERPSDAEALLGRAAAIRLQAAARPADDAMLLIAGMKQCPIIQESRIGVEARA